MVCSVCGSTGAERPKHCVHCGAALAGALAPAEHFAPRAMAYCLLVVGFFLGLLPAPLDSVDLRTRSENAAFRRQMEELTEAVRAYHADTGAWPGDVQTLTRPADPALPGHRGPYLRFEHLPMLGFSFRVEINPTTGEVFLSDRSVRAAPDLVGE